MQRAFVSFRHVLILVTLLAGPAIADTRASLHVRPPRPDLTAATLAMVDAGDLDPTTERMWVYFRDKDVFDADTYAARLADVAANLDEHARARRAKSLKNGPVDFLDVPVSTRHVAALEAAGADVIRRSRWLNAVSIRCTPGVLRHLASLPIVHKIEPVRGVRPSRPLRGRAQGTPGTQRAAGDPFDYGPSRDQLDEIDVIAAHAIGLSGDGVRVASLDTGFDRTHPVFQDIVSTGRLLAQWDFINDDPETMNEAGDDPSQDTHGTITWSTLGGFESGELVGPAFGASFLLAKTEDVTSETPVEEDNWVAAAEWADANGADIISTSLGYSDWYTYADMDGNTAPITIAADIAVSRGIVVCTSAGNQGSSEWFYITAPGDADSVLTVGAVDANNDVADFSGRGPTADGRLKPEVVARGVDAYAALPGPGYFPFDGTSLSCPLVAGAVALVLEAHPMWDPLTVRAALLGSADNATAPDNERGWGRIDVLAAIQNPILSAPPAAPAAPVSHLLAIPNPASHGLRIRTAVPTTVSAPLRVSIFDIGGRSVRAWDAPVRAVDVAWDGRDDMGALVANGVYIVRLSAGDWNASRKVVLRR